MEWFNNWWSSLDSLQQVFSCLAVPATAILLIQTVMLLFGLGGEGDGAADHGGFDGDHDCDTDCDHDHDHSALDDGGMRLITVRGIVAFFAVGGWLGVAMIDLGLHPAIAVLISLAGGFGALSLVAFILKSVMKLQADGNVDYDNAVGLQGEVYMQIPPSCTGKGKINFTVQERYVEVDAMTTHTEPLKRGTLVRVTEKLDSSTLMVELFAVITEQKTADDAELLKSRG